MNPEEIAAYAEELLSIYQRMTPAQKQKYAPLLQEAISSLSERGSVQSPPTSAPPSTPQPQVPAIARELWALSRGDPDVFSLYMQSYPNNSVNAIARNPSELNSIMNQINNTQSQTPRGNADGIEQAPLQSSNVYGYRYDPLQRSLRVRFQNGSVYKYDGVPKIIFDMFKNGDGVARTTGSNRYGRWWRGKTPSLGASVHRLLIAGEFPYQRIR